MSEAELTKFSIPFYKRFDEPLLRGVKTMTCRTRKFGEVGDIFEHCKIHFVLTHVMRMRLGFVASDCFEQEGCKSFQDFREVWEQIHPKTGFDPEQIVWAHCFRRLT